MQFIVISDQLASLLWSLLLGAAFAGCYDALRVVRMLLAAQGIRKLKITERIPTVTVFKGKVGDHLQMLFANITDVLYSLAASASFCIFLYYSNSGRFRWYLLLGCVAGFVLYRLSIGRVVTAVLGYITGIIRTVIGFALFLITRPVLLLRHVLRIAAAPIRNLIKRKKMLRRTEKIRKSLHDAVRFQ